MITARTTNSIVLRRVINSPASSIEGFKHGFQLFLRMPFPIPAHNGTLACYASPRSPRRTRRRLPIARSTAVGSFCARPIPLRLCILQSAQPRQVRDGWLAVIQPAYPTPRFGGALCCVFPSPGEQRARPKGPALSPETEAVRVSSSSLAQILLHWKRGLDPRMRATEPSVNCQQGVAKISRGQATGLSDNRRQWPYERSAGGLARQDARWNVARCCQRSRKGSASRGTLAGLFLCLMGCLIT